MSTRRGRFALSDEEREETLLRLQRLESKWVDALHTHPGSVPRRTEHRLRYALALASLDTFQPGAARLGRRTERAEVRVRSPRLRRWPERVLDALEGPLLRTRDRGRRIHAAAEALEPLLPPMERLRDELIEKYADTFSTRELDQELGIKSLVNAAGGGGGSAYVYIGAWEVMEKAGILPRYLIGASMGAVLGLFRAVRREADLGPYVALAKRMRREEVFRFVSLRTRYGLPGVMRLCLDAGIGHVFRNRDGRRLRLDDMEIPFEAVVAGLRRSALSGSPEEYAMAHHLHEDKRPGPLALRRQIAVQLVNLVGFVGSRASREIVLGSDELTASFDAVDAAGFSAAIPGILHYDTEENDLRMDALLSELCEREEVVALVDGGVANNVPSRTAWRRVQEGVIGTRNAYVLSFDCFHPQITLGHVFLQPLTRVIGLQVASGDRYTHRRVEFRPTLSPLNLLPRPAEVDRAVGWGRKQMSREIPKLQKYLERVRWHPPADGD